jgi:hypothetical protein
MPEIGRSQLRETVRRMERHLGDEGDELLQGLMKAYRDLIPRFERDLADERDILLSRGAALMLIQEMVSRPA